MHLSDTPKPSAIEAVSQLDVKLSCIDEGVSIDTSTCPSQTDTHTYPWNTDVKDNIIIAWNNTEETHNPQMKQNMPSQIPVAAKRREKRASSIWVLSNVVHRNRFGNVSDLLVDWNRQLGWILVYIVLYIVFNVSTKNLMISNSGNEYIYVCIYKLSSLLVWMWLYTDEIPDEGETLVSRSSFRWSLVYSIASGLVCGMNDFLLVWSFRYISIAAVILIVNISLLIDRVQYKNDDQEDPKLKINALTAILLVCVSFLFIFRTFALYGLTVEQVVTYVKVLFALISWKLFLTIGSIWLRRFDTTDHFKGATMEPIKLMVIFIASMISGWSVGYTDASHVGLFFTSHYAMISVCSLLLLNAVYRVSITRTSDTTIDVISIISYVALYITLLAMEIEKMDIVLLTTFVCTMLVICLYILVTT
jgi:hypothetical protein